MLRIMVEASKNQLQGHPHGRGEARAFWVIGSVVGSCDVSDVV